MLNETQMTIVKSLSKVWWEEKAPDFLELLKHASPILQIASVDEANSAYHLALTALQEAIEDVKHLGDSVAARMKKERSDVLEK